MTEPESVAQSGFRKIVDIIDTFGKLIKGYVQYEPKPDRNGLIPLLDPNTNTIIRVHPDRIRPSDESTTGSIAAKLQHGSDQRSSDLVASCPECGETCVVIDDIATCNTHGIFKIIDKITLEVSKTTPTKKKPDLVDKDELAKHGELWIRSGVNFDADVTVESLYYIVGDRYCTFNTYNGTYGKKGNKPPIEEMKQGKAGYKVKDIDKLRKKWAKGSKGKNGAKRYIPKTQSDPRHANS